MNKEDLTADVEMSLRQVISLTDLMLEQNNQSIPNILTIRAIAQASYNELCIQQYKI